MQTSINVRILLLILWLVPATTSVARADFLQLPNEQPPSNIVERRTEWGKVARELERAYRERPNDQEVLRSLIVAYTRLVALESPGIRRNNLCQLIPERIEEYRRRFDATSPEDEALFSQSLALIAFQMQLYPVVVDQLQSVAPSAGSRTLMEALALLGHDSFERHDRFSVSGAAIPCDVEVLRLNSKIAAENEYLAFHYYFLPSFGSKKTLPNSWFTLGSHLVNGVRRYYLYGHRGARSKPLWIFGAEEPSYESVRQRVKQFLAYSLCPLLAEKEPGLSGRRQVLTIIVLVACFLAIAIRVFQTRFQSRKGLTTALLLFFVALSAAAYAWTNDSPKGDGGTVKLEVPPEVVVPFGQYWEDEENVNTDETEDDWQDEPEDVTVPDRDLPGISRPNGRHDDKPIILPVRSDPPSFSVFGDWADSSPKVRMPDTQPATSQTVSRQFGRIHAVQTRVLSSEQARHIRNHVPRPTPEQLKALKEAQELLSKDRVPPLGLKGLEMQACLSDLIDVYQGSVQAENAANGDDIEPEVAAGLARDAFGERVEGGDVAVKPAYSSPLFQIQPEVMDDAGPLLRHARHMHNIEVPLPKVPEVGPARPVVKGVKFLIDERLLAGIVARQKTANALVEMVELEDTLLEARTPEEAVRTVDEYVDRQQQRFLEFNRDRFTEVDELHLVSLKQFHQEASSYRDRWTQRPRRLHTIGQLTRIVGYLLDRKRGDVWLVGERAPEAPPISSDCLIVGLNVIWKKNKSPMCSLDSTAQAIAGPQRVRLIDVPADSEFASIMLDADYAMKRIMMKAEGEDLQIPGFTPLEKMLGHDSPAAGYTRFWLTAESPSDHSIQLGPYGTSALFDICVRVETEEMLVAGLDTTGAGRPSPWREHDAQAFTEHYDEIAQQRPIFHRLENLYQVAMLSKILRLTACDHPVLDAVASLPYERVDVPQSYPGITVEHQRGRLVFEISGGCDLNPRVSSRVYLEVATPAHDRLINSTSGAAESEAGIRSISAPLLVPKHKLGNRTAAAYNTAMQLFTSEKWKEAQAAFTQLIEANPSWPELYERRALARWHLGQWRPAFWDAAVAMRLDPEEVEFRVTFAYLLLESGQESILNGLKAEIRRPLAERYFVRGMYFAERNADRQAANRAYQRALDVQPQNVDALLFLGMSYAEVQQHQKAVGYFDRALAQKPDDAFALSFRGASRMRLGQFDDALADYDRAVRADSRNYFAWCFRATLRGYLEDYQGAINDASRAIELRPEAAEPYVVRGSAQAFLAETTPHRSRQLYMMAADDLKRALQLAADDDPMRRPATELLDDVLKKLKGM